MTLSTAPRFSQSYRDGVLIVELSGALDCTLALEQIAELTQTSPAQNVVVNLAGLEYINSAGFSALIRLSDLARQNHKTLYLTGLERKVHVALRWTNATQFLNIVPSLNEALAHTQTSSTN